MGRVYQAKKNIIFGYAGNIVILFMNFLQRTVFIRTLGMTLLGVNGIYTELLTVLAMTELGIGTALNYSLYKPVAEQDREKIKSYMLFYKKAYLIIACVISVLGIAVSPFLRYILKNPGNLSIRELTLYYYIFLFNTVITYFVSYKYSLVNAEQKNYIQTNINAVTKVVETLVQILVLVFTRSFLLYLLSKAAVEVLQKIVVSVCLNRMYPYLREKNVQKLSREETGIVAVKTKALICHKVGDVARSQTDRIVISSFVNVDMSAVVDNYTYIVTYVGGFVNIIFDSLISGFGNLVATESKEKQYQLFRVYHFMACWLFGFGAVGFWHLLTPLIGGLWLDSEWTLSGVVVTLMMMEFYFKGERIVLLNFKIASGLFEQDRYLPLIQGAVNLVVSVVLVQKIGVVGVYVGTVVSGLLANFVRPLIVYRVCFAKSGRSYFVDSLKYMVVVIAAGAVLVPVRNVVMNEVTFFSFVLTAVIISLLYNGAFLAVFHGTEEFRYLWNAAVGKLPTLKKFSGGREG